MNDKFNPNVRKMSSEEKVGEKVHFNYDTYGGYGKVRGWIEKKIMNKKYVIENKKSIFRNLRGDPTEQQEAKGLIEEKDLDYQKLVGDYEKSGSVNPKINWKLYEAKEGEGLKKISIYGGGGGQASYYDS